MKVNEAIARINAALTALDQTSVQGFQNVTNLAGSMTVLKDIVTQGIDTDEDAKASE